MSDNQQEQKDEILDRNVGELLRHGHRPPQIEAAARGKILAALKEKLPAPAPAPVKPSRERGFLASLFGTPLRAGLVAAAAASAIVVGGVMLSSDRDVAPTASFEPREVRNEGVGPQRVELVDGSSAILRSGAAIHTRGVRSLELLSGDVVFDIAKSDRPFVISRPNRTERVVVLGTRFYLRADDDRLLAAVIRGRVRLENSAGDVTLGAGEGAEARGEATPTRVPIPRLSHLVSWSRGARARSEGMDAKPVRTGNLVARRPGSNANDYPLPIRNYGVNIHLENQVARVAIDQTFFNPLPMQLEGVYSFSLPAGAAVSRLAMYVNGKLMEAGISERTHARNTYESIVYRRRDPALMEWMAGNETRLRIFPLFARQEKRILLSYTQSIDRLYDDAQLTVPLPRPEDPVGVMSIEARLANCAECVVASTSHAIETEVSGSDLLVRYHGKSVRIEDDLILTVRQPERREHIVMRRTDGETLLLARVTPDLDQQVGARNKRRRWVLLHDTSGSRSRMESLAQVHVIDRLLEELDENDEVALVAFDATIRKFDGGRFTSISNADRKAAHDFADEQNEGVGHTDLALGLETAASLLESAPGADNFEPMIIYLGDGVATSGDRKLSDLAKAVGGRAKVISVAVGASHDDAVLKSLASETGGLSLVLNQGQDLDWRIFDLVASLHSDRVTELTAEIPGRDEAVYLSTKQLAAGDELSLTARVGAQLPTSIRLRGKRSGKPWTLDIDLGANVVFKSADYLPRLWARKRIESLLADEGLSDRKHASEITRLALKHWLLTPYTSLLVLETEADYKRFKVVRSSMEGWASYQVPKEIKVVVEPLGQSLGLAAAGITALILRSPESFFAEPQALYGDMISNTRGGFGFGVSGVRGVGGGGGGWGTIGLGRYGTIGHGSGTGRGYGAGEGAAEVEFEDKQASTSRRVQTAAFGPPRESTKSLDANKAKQRIVWAGQVQGRRSRRDSGFFELSSRGGKRGYRYAEQSALVTPKGFEYPSTRAFRDLSLHARALASGEVDQARLALAAEVKRRKQKSFDVDAKAAALLNRARELVIGRRYQTSDGQRIDVLASGGLHIVRQTELGLSEELRYDGSRLTTRYPDFDLAVERPIGPAEQLLFEEVAPMLIARPESLARSYAISLEADKAVALTPPGATWRLLIRVGDDGRLASIDHVAGRITTRVLEAHFAAQKLTLTLDGVTTRYKISDNMAPAVAVAEPSVVVKLPLRHPDFVRGVTEAEPSRANLHQLAASLAALEQFSDLSKLALEMSAQAPLTDGELVLLSGGITRTPASAARALGAKPTTDIGRYLASDPSASARGRRAAAKGLAETGTGWIGAFAQLRAGVTHSSSGYAAVATSVSELINRKAFPTLAYIAASEFDRRRRWNPPKELIAAWQALADSDQWWTTSARIRLAHALAAKGKYALAFAEWEKIRDRSFASGQFPPLDYQAKNQLSSGARGVAGWRSFWSRARERALSSSDTGLKMGLLESAVRLGLVDEVPRIAVAIADAKPTVTQRLQIVQLVSRAGIGDVSMRLFEPLEGMVASGELRSPDVLRMASRFAAARGDQLGAAKLGHRAIDSEGDASMAQIRADYGAVTRLYVRAALLANGANRADAIAAMRGVAREWRSLDPDNPNLDETVAGALFSLGSDQEARRVLSTTIERRPMEGASYETVATMLEGQGHIDDSIELWRRAIEVEPENPTWLLRGAQALRSAGRTEEAKKMLTKVVSRKDWQERFWWILQQAKATLKRL